MIDPVTALGVATTAFNAIKTGFQGRRDVEGMAGDLSRWMGAVSDIKKGRRTKPKTTTIQKTICGWFCRRGGVANTHGKKEDRRYERSTQEYYYVFQRSWCLSRRNF